MHLPAFPDGGTIDVQFRCPKCNEIIEVTAVEIPSPFMGADNEAESTTYGQRDEIECDNCHETFEVSSINTMYGWYIEIENYNGFSVDRVKYANESYPDLEEKY